MRRFKSLFILLVFVLGLFPKVTLAAPIEVDSQITGIINVRWIDYENKTGERPDEIEVELYDFGNDEYVTKTLKEKDAQITVNQGMTVWTFEVKLPNLNDNTFYNLGTPPIISGYTYDRMASGGVINTNGGSINLVFTKHFSKYVTYTEHWDDGGARDVDRVFAMWMIPINNDMLGEDDGFPMSLGCGRNKDAYIDDNTCQTSIYIPYAYPFDENNMPIWDDPTKFEYRMYDMITDYDYDYKVDEKGNIDVYIKHVPYMIDDSLVEVIWDDNDNKNGKRPNEISLDLYNHDEKEQSITVSDDNWKKEITNLYKNYLHGKASDYSLKINNTNDYEFVIKGNNVDGFKVYAKYIGQEIDTNLEGSEIKDEQINPKTNDNIVLYIVLLIVAILAMITSVFFLKKKNSK